MDLDKAQERELIERAKQGDEGAFERIYDLYKARTYSLCLRMTSNTADAEDLVQEAMIQVHQKLYTFRGDSQFSTWCYRVVANTVLMHLRRKRLPIIALEEALKDDSPKNILSRDDLSLAYAVERYTLIEAIKELPDGYRTIFMLHEVEGYEHNEIARMLDCSVGNSKSQLHRAKLRLRLVVGPRFQPAQ